MPPKKSKVTRSSPSLKQRQVIDSLASVTSPPKASKTKKSSKKQAPLESPEEKGIIAQVVTNTKQAKSSSDDNSTGSKSALFVPQINMADPRLDAKLEHLFTEYCLAVSNNHEIRQMFKGNDLYQFEDFIRCDIQSLTEMKRKKYNTTVPFNHWKLTLIHDVVLYYKFLRSDAATRTLAKTRKIG